MAGREKRSERRRKEEREERSERRRKEEREQRRERRRKKEGRGGGQVEEICKLPYLSDCCNLDFL